MCGWIIFFNITEPSFLKTLFFALRGVISYFVDNYFSSGGSGTPDENFKSPARHFIKDNDGNKSPSHPSKALPKFNPNNKTEDMENNLADSVFTRDGKNLDTNLPPKSPLDKNKISAIAPSY
jgi:hypothetical protein